ncbi:glycoside hydrolase family 172 protein [Pedobacter sp. B4-66]|uniref:glycoside hydrolase family 172 protein n=1 Tax=Pedobacter sp. B4-66 TaxID=2817280 RepID=UPI001BDA5B0B|nr:glycoside hydrolase family 172 protein [Pedobacter sp. B4-66]
MNSFIKRRFKQPIANVLKVKIPALILILVMGLDSYAQMGVKPHQEVTLATLLEEMTSVESDVVFPEPYYTSKLQTSYDRRSVLPGTSSWHANDDGAGFIRYEANQGRVEKVLFDQLGPGVLTRIITTGKAVGTNLRLYFDDEPEARIVIPAYDIARFPVQVPAGLLYKHEHYATTQGSSFYYPIPYSKRCKITVDDLNRPHYFHANYRTYAPGTPVKTFTIEDASELQSKVDKISTTLLNPTAYSMGATSISKKMTKGSVVKLKLPDGAKAIRTLSFKINGFRPEDYGQLMRGLIVKATFDGTETVRAPLSDFSGAGMGAPKVDSWYLTADGKGNVTMRFTMPYQKSATIALENISEYDAKVSLSANVSDWKWKENTLYFHAAWRQENKLETNKGLDYNNASLVGRGIFKGDLLSLYNYSKRWYGEGDEHIWVDDEKFPSHFGCGTEDYYNTTFAPIHVYFLPFGGAPREDDEASRGYNTFLRTRNLDVIPFKKNLKLEFELISWDGGVVDYSSTVYWYGDLDSKSLNPSQDRDALYVLPPPIYTNTPNKN